MTDLLLFYKLAMRLTGVAPSVAHRNSESQEATLRSAELDCQASPEDALVIDEASHDMDQLAKTLTAGKAWPLGVSLTETGCNVAVYSQTAHQLWLCLFNEEGKETACIPLPACSNGVWHGHIEGMQVGQQYGFRASGLYAPEKGLLFDEAKLLIDPYAKALTDTVVWHERLACHPDQLGSDTAEWVPKAIVVNDVFDWEDDSRPVIDPEKRVVYEVHVKGFTKLHPEVPEQYRGTYLGLCSPAVIAYLKALGVTTLQLMPCFSFMTEPRLEDLDLVNYWGYNPINFFTPDWRYATEDPISEFKTMVKTLHAAGFEVILDVVYNHTAEGELDQAWISYKGLDNLSYYLLADDVNDEKVREYRASEDYQKAFTCQERCDSTANTTQPMLPYANYSGCGNSLNMGHTQVHDLILSSLRYWVQDMHLDGFRFDLAASLGRDARDFSTQARLLTLCQHDPVLRHCLLIAEPWDIGPHGYQLGQFDHPWFEVNDKFRDECRDLWQGNAQLLSAFCTRLMGSRDIFCKASRPHVASVNCVTYHDGFTLEDLVSFEEKHNHANGEGNVDGHGHNLSKNHGVEGSTDDSAIVLAREQHKRNLFLSLMLSRGTPHLLAGDELGRSQQGNNNAYCQDNEISWQSWDIEGKDAEFLRFCQQVIALRYEGAGLNHAQFMDENYQRHHHKVALSWFNISGQTMSIADWHGETEHFVALHIDDESAALTWQKQLLLINPGDKDLTFVLPEALQDLDWSVALTTQCTQRDSHTQKEAHVQKDTHTQKETRVQSFSYPVAAESMLLLHVLGDG